MSIYNMIKVNKKKKLKDIETKYLKCIDNEVTFFANKEELNNIKHNLEFVYKPLYKAKNKEMVVSEYDDAAKNKTYHDFSELQGLFINKKVLGEQTVYELNNKIVLDFLLAIPQNKIFKVYVKQTSEVCFAMFTENQVFQYNTDCYKRKLRTISGDALIRIQNDKNLQEKSRDVSQKHEKKNKKTLPKEKKRKKKDKKPKMTYLGSKKVGEKVGNKIIYSFENATPRSTHCSDFDKQISAPIITKHLDLLSGAGGLNDYHEYSMNDNRIVYTSTRNNDAFVLLEENNIAQNIQLIKSSRNHVTMHHDVRNVNAKMIVYDKTIKAFRRMNMAVHYCNKCHKYFDYYESFTHQLSQNNIPITNILINYFDDNDEYIQFDTYNLKEHSRLSLLGYSVGQSGLPRFKRQFLIDKIIDKKLMTASQIKNHLEFLIRFQGHNSNMKNAVSSWKEDIDYINKCIMKGKY